MPISRLNPPKGNDPVFISMLFEDDKTDWDFTIIMMDVIYPKSPEK